ncbi:MAG: N-6 DNA methylase [Candidatus Paceibacterota bacterium]|jgi:type I restriction enzyme M protein
METATISIQEKDNKIFSHIRKIWLIKTPEEIVRQNYLLTLINEYGYSLDQIDEELAVTGRGSGKARADFVIWKSAEDKQKSKSPLIIVECKSDNVTISTNDYSQGENYARITDAPFFTTHNSKETKYWRVKKDRMPGYTEEIEDMPKSGATDKQIEDLLARLKVFKENEFADLLHSCHNIIRNREKLDPAAAFDEIAKILFMKVYAERNLKTDMKNNIFTLDYVEQAETFNPDYLDDIFEKTKREFGKDRIFANDEKINLRANTIKAIIEKLEKYNLSGTSTDIKGIAFEKFLGKTFRGEIGQFFTPRPIVEFMVQMVAPKEDDVICDPASGSGGFLIRFFEIVREQIYKSVDKEYQKEKVKIEKEKGLSEEEKAGKLTEVYNELQKKLDKEINNSRIWKLANRCVYGTDANDRMARTSKMNMIMHGDGHGGIHHHDGFLNVNGIFEERFDIILTNPPFGQSVEKDDTVVDAQIELDEETISYYHKIYGEAYANSQAKIKAAKGKPVATLFEMPKGNSIKTELLFIERCLSLLKPGGRMGIVLPEGVYNNPSLAYVRQFAEDRAKISAIISIPQETFVSAKAFVKTSLLFLQKFTEEERKGWSELLGKKHSEILTKQKKDREDIDVILKDRKADKEKKKESNAKLKELDEFLQSEARRLARIDFDYPIFMCEAERVGISSTGEEDKNELPQIFEEYMKFQKDPSGYQTKN